MPAGRFRHSGSSIHVAAAAMLALVICADTARATTQMDDTLRAPGAAFRRNSVVALPAVFYTPETRLGGGAALLHALRTSAHGRPIASAASVMYTQNGQVLAGLSTDAWLDDSRHHVAASVGYSRFPTIFYGIGNATSVTDSETYTPRTFAMDAAVERRIAPGIYVGLTGDVGDTHLVEVEPGRALASGTIRGSSGGRAVGMGVSLTYDTRDNILAAESGGYARVAVRGYGAMLGSDYGFTSTRVDLRRYRAFAHHVFAVQASWSGVAGDVPFDRIPKLGGQNLLRGYFEGRFRDRHYAAAQAEYRTPSWHRLGLASFAGAGEVAPSVGKLTLRGIHAAGGAGLRVMLSRQERLALRLDYGAGHRSSGFYVTVGEAF